MENYYKARRSILKFREIKYDFSVKIVISFYSSTFPQYTVLSDSVHNIWKIIRNKIMNLLYASVSRNILQYESLFFPCPVKCKAEKSIHKALPFVYNNCIIFRTTYFPWRFWGRPVGGDHQGFRYPYTGTNQRNEPELHGIQVPTNKGPSLAKGVPRSNISRGH